MNFVKCEVKFINAENNNTLCEYDSFQSLYEVAETCNLLMYEKNIDKIRVDLVVEGEVKKQYLKVNDSKLEVIK